VGQICTGVLVGPAHVLTAGHCGCGDPESYRVHLEDNAYDQTTRAALPPVLFDARACLSPPYPGIDLALLTLKKPLRCTVALAVRAKVRDANGEWRLDDQLAPVDCRSDEAQAVSPLGMGFGFPPEPFWNLQDKLPVGQMLKVFGYGNTDRIQKGRRMFGWIPVSSPACTERHLQGYCAPFAELVLTSAPGPVRRIDTCSGDSGGPVFLIENDRYTLVALTSRPAPVRQDDPVLNCGGGGIYTILGRQTVRTWLEANGVKQAQLVSPFAPAPLVQPAQPAPRVPPP
jgi:hypothetical protein